MPTNAFCYDNRVICPQPLAIDSSTGECKFPKIGTQIYGEICKSTEQCFGELICSNEIAHGMCNCSIDEKWNHQLQMCTSSITSIEKPKPACQGTGTNWFRHGSLFPLFQFIIYKFRYSQMQ